MRGGCYLPEDATLGRVGWSGGVHATNQRLLLRLVACRDEPLLERPKPGELRPALRADRRRERAPRLAATLSRFLAYACDARRRRLPRLPGARPELYPDARPLDTRRCWSGRGCGRSGGRRSRDHRHGRRFGRWRWLWGADSDRSDWSDWLNTWPRAGRDRRDRTLDEGRGGAGGRLVRGRRGDARNGGRSRRARDGDRRGLRRRGGRGRGGGDWRLSVWQQPERGGGG